MNPCVTPVVRGWPGHLGFGVTALACTSLFAWMVTFGTFSFVAEDSFGSFYDHQAAAWLQGRWDVPEAALQGEAFVVNGKVYGYFGPTPALLRVPLAALGVAFASTTRVWMLLQYIACLGAAYALLRLATRWRDPASPISAWASAIFTLIVGLGTTLFFLGSRAYVYHEAILCGTAFALWSVVCAFRFLESPRSRWWIGALICAVLSVHARAPVGLFALLVLASVALWHAYREFKVGARQAAARSGVIAGLAGAGLASFNLVSYLKFGTIEGCPLRYNVQYTTEQLAVLGHRNFHLSNLRFNTDTYLRRPIFSISAEFPYVYRAFINRREYPESRIAYRDPVLALPWSMTALLALAIGGSLLVFARRAAGTRVALGATWSAGLAAALAMLTAVAVTHRYTADFLPFLITAAAFGLTACEALSGRLRATIRALTTALAVLGVAVTGAITLHHQREIVWGVPAEVRREYQGWRENVARLFGGAPRTTAENSDP
jgi:hypothetical protein